MLAESLGTVLRLLGAAGDGVAGRCRRDASRLLARASLLVQQVVGIVTEPMLVPGRRGRAVIDAAARRTACSWSDCRSAGRRGHRAGARGAVAAAAAAPTLFVRRGVRANGLGPAHTLTRFSWTLTGTRG